MLDERGATPKARYGIPPPAFRLPDAAHVGLVRLQVTDLDRSVEYYGRVIGLHAFSRTDDMAVLTPQNGDRPLLALHTRRGLTRARRGALGLYHFAILLPDRSALGRFAAHLANLGVRIGTADHLVSEAFYLSDPDGLGIEVYADRPRQAWRAHGGELAMTTDPLDLAGVTAAAGNRPWQGAPAGTTMGHVHLHVGAIEEAEAFYHRAVGFDKTVWSYPGALFLSAGGYHHHLGTNVWSPGPPAREDEARLLEWELVVPSPEDVAALGRSLASAGYEAHPSSGDLLAVDPWGTTMRVVVSST